MGPYSYGIAKKAEIQHLYFEDPPSRCHLTKHFDEKKFPQNHANFSITEIDWEDVNNEK